jgi:hypothetical protein
MGVDQPRHVGNDEARLLLMATTRFGVVVNGIPIFGRAAVRE